jgi:hypothetical protein
MKPSLFFLVAPVLSVPTALSAEPLTPARVEMLQAQVRGSFFVPNPLPALAAKTHRRFAPAPGVVAEAVTYATEFGTRAMGASVPGYRR